METSEVQFAVIINSFNRLALLKDALHSLYEALLATKEYSSAIVIVDAGSTDGSLAYVSEFAKEHSTIPTEVLKKEGCTFSEGCNAGVAHASKLFPGMEYFMLYETDNYIRNEKALSLGLELLKSRPELAALGFTVEKHSGEKVVYGNRFPSFLSFALGQQISYYFKLYQTRVKSISKYKGYYWFYGESVFTSPLLVKLDAWLRVGGMDENNFPFCDSDTDLCWKIVKNKMSIAVLKLSGIIHDNRAVISSWSDKRVQDYHRARLALLIKHKGKLYYALFPILLIRHTIELFLLIISRKPKNKIGARFLLTRSLLTFYKS